MNAAFRLVHFVPDPFAGGRWPVAALVERAGGGGVEVVRSAVIPGPDCLGGRQAHATCELVLQSLRHVVGLERLPSEVGSCAELGPVVAVPTGVENPAEWVRRHVLPSRGTERDEPGAARSPRRSRYGEQFLRRWAVERFVRPHFVASKHVPDVLTADGSRLPAVTHWVKGRSEILLMEPLAPVRQDVVVDAKQVWRQFAAYAYAIEHGGPSAARLRLVAYVLGGGERNLRAEAIAAVKHGNWDVVDTENDAERDEFVRTIRTTGESAEPASAGLFG